MQVPGVDGNRVGDTVFDEVEGGTEPVPVPEVLDPPRLGAVGLAQAVSHKHETIAAANDLKLKVICRLHKPS